MNKIRIDVTDPETSSLWTHIKRTAAEVATWPKWKGGDDMPRWWDNLGHNLLLLTALAESNTRGFADGYKEGYEKAELLFNEYDSYDMVTGKGKYR